MTIPAPPPASAHELTGLDALPDLPDDPNSPRLHDRPIVLNAEQTARLRQAEASAPVYALGDDGTFSWQTGSAQAERARDSA